MLNTAGRFMTIKKGAAMKKIDLALIKNKLFGNVITPYNEINDKLSIEAFKFASLTFITTLPNCSPRSVLTITVTLIGHTNFFVLK